MLQNIFSSSLTLLLLGGLMEQDTSASEIPSYSHNQVSQIKGLMHISASILNAGQQNNVTVTTNNTSKYLAIPPKTEGKGSSVNGGELLFLALATCICNDIYREAAKRQMLVTSVEVHVSGEFGSEGEPGFNIQYKARVDANASADEIQDLIAYVDKVAEVHNTLRAGTSVTLMENNTSTQ